MVIKTLDAELDPDRELGKMLDPDPDSQPCRAGLTNLNFLILDVLWAGAAPPAVVLGQFVLVVGQLAQPLHLRRSLLPPL